MKNKLILSLLLLATGLGARAQNSKYFVTTGGNGSTYSTTYPALASPTGALSFSIGNAAGTAVDPQGNIYFTDPVNNVICEIEKSTGNVFYIAGIPGTAGDGMTTTAATAAGCALKQPYAITYNRWDGNLYFTDIGTHKVGVLIVTGTPGVFDIKKIVGTGSATPLTTPPAIYVPATYATLRSPKGITADASGGLYISDGGNKLVRKIDLTVTNPMLEIFAGNTATGVLEYVTGSGYPSARSVSLNNTIEGLAWEPTYNDIYIADRGGHRVLMVGGSGGSVTGTGGISTIAGNENPALLPYAPNGSATAVGLDDPYTITVDNARNLYVGNHNGVVIVNGAGVQTFAGDPDGTLGLSTTSNCVNTTIANSTMGYTGGTTGPVGLTYSGRQELMYADNATNVIRRLNFPTEKGAYYCAPGAPLERIELEGASIGSSATFQWIAGTPTGAYTSLLGTAMQDIGGTGATFTSAIYNLYTPTNDIDGTSYSIALTDPGCSTAIAMPDITVQLSTGPNPIYVTAGSDYASGSVMTLYETSDGCNCGIRAYTASTEERTSYYIERTSPSPTTYPAYYTGACSAGRYGALYGYLPPYINGTGSRQEFTILAERDGCFATMPGTIVLDDPGHVATVASVTASNNTLSSCNSTITFTVSNPTAGKTYQLIDATTLASFSHLATSGSPFTFTVSKEGYYTVHEQYLSSPASRQLCNPITITRRSLSVDMTAPMAVTDDNAYTLCPGHSTFSLQANIDGTAYSTSPVTYSISGPGGYTASNTTGSFTPPAIAATGVYTVTSTPPAGGGCAMTTTVTIVVPTATAGCSPCDYFVPNIPATSGCSAPACSGCSDVQAFHTVNVSNITKAVLPLSTNPVKNIWITQSSAAISEDVRFDDNVIFFTQNQGLGISSVGSATFNNCHLFSCDWKGISIGASTTSAGRVSLTGNTLIENVRNMTGTGGAYAAVKHANSTNSFVSQEYNAFNGSGCVINSEEVIFNKNNIDISSTWAPVLNTNIFELPYHITNTIFTSRDFECYNNSSPVVPQDYYPFTWPKVSDLKVVTSTANPYDPDYAIDLYASNASTNHTRAIFFLGGNSDASDNYYSMVVGDRYDATKSNLIDNIIYNSSGGAVSMYNSSGSGCGNMTLYNTVFRRLAFSGGTPSIGVYMRNDVATRQRKLTLSGDMNGGYNCGNIFYCKTPIVANGKVDLNIRQSQMYGQDVLTDVSWGTSSPAICMNINVGPKTELIVSNNHIVNYKLGVNINSIYAGSTGVLEVKNNVIEDYIDAGDPTSPAPTPSPYTQYLNTGIIVNSVNGAVLTADVSNNRVTNAAYGVKLSGFNASPTIVNSNTITLRDYTSGTGLTSPGGGLYGLTLNSVASTSGTPLDVQKNKISGAGYQSPAYTINTSVAGVKGFSLVNIGNSTSHSIVKCNVVSDINIGFAFSGTNYADWKGNAMVRNSYGLLLGGSGTSFNPTVGTCSAPDDNTWEGAAVTGGWPGWPTGAPTTTTSTTPPLQTYSYSSPVTSPMYYRGTTGIPADDKYVPSKNGGSTTNAYNLTGTASLFDLSATCGAGTIPAYDGSCLPAHSKPANNVITTVNTAEKLQTYSLFPNPNTGNITISQQEVVDGAVVVRVMNAVGASVYEGRLDFFGGQAQLSLPDVASGMYIVELRDSNNKRFSTKMVVAK